MAKQMQVLLDDVSVREHLETLLVLACHKRQPSRESLTRIDNALRLILVLTERIPTSPKLLKAVLQSISSSVVLGMLRQGALQDQEAISLGFVHGHSTVEGTLCILSKISYSDLILSYERCFGSFCLSDVSRSSPVFLKREILTPKSSSVSFVLS